MAAAGPDLHVAANETFALDASESDDPDGSIQRYEWAIVYSAGASVAVLNGEQIGTAVAEPGTYRITLVVDNGTGVSNATASDDLVLTVNAGPLAVAGTDLAVSVGECVPLDASGKP